MIFTILLLLDMVFGLVFYDLPAFQFFDELFPFILLTVSIIQKKKVHKSLFIVLAIALFYLVYSFAVKSNEPLAILFDFTCLLKPFITLYAVIVLKPQINKAERDYIKYAVLAMIPFLLFCGIRSFGVEETIQGELLSGARLGFCCLYLSFTYYYFSSHRTMDFIIMIAISSIGFLVPTSKFLATIIVTISVFALTKRSKIRLTILPILVTLLSAAAIVFLASEDLIMYFSDEVARGAMYLAAGSILLDYFPFGSGFASFASPASATFYSDIYFEYGLNNIYGLTPEDPKYASDAFFPILAQYGFIGLVLFVIFFVSLFKNTYAGNCRYSYRLSLIILLSILVESISDVSLIGNRGVYAMLLLGYMFSNKKHIRYVGKK